MASTTDIETRRVFILSGLLDGKTTKQVKAEWQAKFGLTGEATWWRDMTEARKRLQEINNNMIGYERDVFLARYDALYEKAVDKDDLKTAADITNKAVKLLGLEKEQVEVSTPNEITIEFK